MKIEDLLVLTEQELLGYIETQLKKLGVKYITCDDYIVTTQHNVSTPLICIHTDTISKVAPKHEDLLVSGNLLALSQNSKAGCLGADDRAGVWIALEMLADGTETEFEYAFFAKEEVGALGSSEFAAIEDLTKYTCFIGLDRASRGSIQNVATYGYDNDTLTGLFKSFGFKEQNGSFSDCSNLASYGEVACINLSVGYDHEHSTKEILNIDLMLHTLDVMKSIVIPEITYDATVVVRDYGINWRYTSGFVTEYEEASPVICDYCGEFLPLYDYQGSLVCRECLELVGV